MSKKPKTQSNKEQAEKYLQNFIDAHLKGEKADAKTLAKNVSKYVNKNVMIDCFAFHLAMINTLQDRVRKLNAELAIAKGKETTKPSNLMFFAILIVGIVIGYFGGME